MTTDSLLQAPKITQSNSFHSYIQAVRSFIVISFSSPFSYFVDFGSDTSSSEVFSVCSPYKELLKTETCSPENKIYQGFCVTPYLWTVFHVAAIERNNRIFNSTFDYSSFKVPSLLDYYQKTPLHYLASQSNLDYPSINFMLRYIVDYIEDTANHTSYETEQVLHSLGPLFKFILQKTNPQLKDRYLSLCYQASRSTVPLPQFGDPETRYVFSKTPVVDQSIQKEIYRTGEEQVKFKTIMVYAD